MYRFLILFCALAAAACGNRGNTVRTEHVETPAPRVFLPVIAPQELDQSDKRNYLRTHYWDRFDFADTVFIAQIDTMQMIEAFASYVMLISDRPTDGSPMDSLMRRVSLSKPMLSYFAMLADRVLADPNSPLRNGEFLIPVLETLVASPFYNEYEKMAPAYDLRMAQQNRLGQPANDFRYTLASGATGLLYGLRAEYVLIFIYNPGCTMCREIREVIAASPMLSELIERGEMKLLAIYPDEDIQAWREYCDQIPESWINAYDKGNVMRKKELYDLHAIPALYLLDSQKRVLVRDAVDVPYIESVIDQRN